MATTTWENNIIYPKKFNIKLDRDNIYDNKKYYTYDSRKYLNTYQNYDEGIVNSTLSTDIDNYRDVYTLMIRANISLPRNQITPEIINKAIKQLQKQVEDHIYKELNNMVVHKELYGKGIPTLLEESNKDLVVEPVKTKQLAYEKYIKENKNAITS